jgi:gliding motility-associated-like protein
MIAGKAKDRIFLKDKSFIERQHQDEVIQRYINISLAKGFGERCIFSPEGLTYFKEEISAMNIKTVVFGIILSIHAVAAWAQDCPALLAPVEGETNVPVETSISWETVVGVTGYIISVGTSPGATDLVNEQQVGNDTSFTPPQGLPENTTVYVTLTLFFFNQDNIVCPSQAFSTELITEIPECTELWSPAEGATNVNVGTSISWNYAPKATGYRLSLGTTAGGTEILNNLDLGNVFSYNPSPDLPFDTEIFATLIPYNAVGSNTACSSSSFTTAGQGAPPDCSSLIYPPNGAVNVGLSPYLEWAEVPGALGYRLYIGSSPFNADVLDGGVFTDNATFVLNFESNNTYYVTIVPFNDAGDALGCLQESFSTILGCGPFYDPDTGELTSLYPDIDFPDQVGICNNQVPYRVEVAQGAYGFRWYREQGTDELLVSEENGLDLYQEGNYRLEAYNTITYAGESIECAYIKEFSVSFSGPASVNQTLVTRQGYSFTVELLVSGPGSYEYSLDGENFQPEPVFNGLSDGDVIIYINDLNGCGTIEHLVRLRFPPKGFPPYFSPNEDGINDVWAYEPPLINPLQLMRTTIFDRFGKTLYRFSPEQQGWDGRYRGIEMPADGYWYRSETADGGVFTGHFSLVR